MNTGHSDEIPNPAAAVSRLLPLLRETVSLFDVQTLEATDFFSVRGMPVDVGLHSHIVRHGVRHGLRSAGFTTSDISNSGLKLLFDPYSLWVWKSQGPSIPPPGTSKPKARYLAQQLEFSIDDNTNEFRVAAETNMVLLWSVTAQFTLDSVYLACPKEVRSAYGKVDTHWVTRLNRASLAEDDASLDDYWEDIPIDIDEEERGIGDSDV